MATLRVREAFAVPQGGISRVMRPGDLVRDDDPIVKGREGLFEPIESAVSRNEVRVEQATGAPGEKRSITPPAKKAAPKSSGKD